MKLNQRPVLLGLVGIVGLVVVSVIPVGGDAVASRFIASLRIAKPKTVTGGVPGVGGGRLLQNVVAGILAETTTVATDEADTLVASLDVASRVAGVRPLLVRARDSASFEVVGAHSATVRVNRGQLETLLAEAGRPASVADSLDGKTVVMARGRGIRIRYGRCPAPIANTIQNQIQGPPPPSTDNGNCVILTQIPLVTLTVPRGLDTASVMEIALELSGMSPNQARDLRSVFDWRSVLALVAPRGIRSYEIVAVGDSKAMLMISAGRREPTYVLAWARGGVVFSLAGYGSSADAAALAGSVR